MRSLGHLRTPGVRSIVVLGAVAIALLLSQGIVGAAAPSRGSAVIEQENENCGITQGRPVIGVARFSRSGDTLTVRYGLSDGQANTTYTVTVWDAVTCDQIGGNLGTFTTNGQGVGHARVQANVAGFSSFFATGFDGTNYHDSLSVALP